MLKTQSPFSYPSDCNLGEEVVAIREGWLENMSVECEMFCLTTPILQITPTFFWLPLWIWYGSGHLKWIITQWCTFLTTILATFANSATTHNYACNKGCIIWLLQMHHECIIIYVTVCYLGMVLVHKMQQYHWLLTHACMCFWSNTRQEHIVWEIHITWACIRHQFYCTDPSHWRLITQKWKCS